MDLTPKLPLHKVIPSFTLPDKHGETYASAKNRGRQHMLLMIFQPGVDPLPFLQQVAASVAEWQQLPARGIIVVASEDAAGRLGAQPFTVLIDAADKMRSRFLPPDAQAGVFALDRYADLYHQWLVADQTQLPAAADINGWLQAIAMQCTI